MSKVVGIHFVCRDDANVVDRGDGSFESGIWVVGKQHRGTIEYIALHQNKATKSYRHGRVVSWRALPWNGRERVIFTVRQEGSPLDWEGGGSGERGYAWR